MTSQRHLICCSLTSVSVGLVAIVYPSNKDCSWLHPADSFRIPRNSSQVTCLTYDLTATMSQLTGYGPCILRHLLFDGNEEKFDMWMVKFQAHLHLQKLSKRS